MAEIDELAAGLRGKLVLHVNATAFGGGVAEILHTLVPLTSDAGLPAERQVVTAPSEFYNVTRSFHNGLQGHPVDFPAAARPSTPCATTCPRASPCRCKRSPRRSTPSAAGLALRPAEGPAGRCRRLPNRQGEGAGHAARFGGLHGDPDLLTRSNLDNVGSVEINAFQSHADVIVQKSTREGFGLTVTEGLWKARPTIGGDVGGIPLQIEDWVTGYLVKSAAQCAERCLQVLAKPEKHRRMALLGKEHVRREFLTPRLLRDDLRLFTDLQTGKIGR